MSWFDPEGRTIGRRAPGMGTVQPDRCWRGHSELGFVWEGHRWRCRECARARYQLYRERHLEEHRARHRERQREWRARNLEKCRAHAAVAEAIRTGELTRPDDCERCGADGQIQASHTDYSRPLDVEWLCPMCHAAKDSELRRAA